MKTVQEHPELLERWNYTKNNLEGLFPDKITLGSEKKAWWSGECGHSWNSRICNQARGAKCPYCAGRLLQGLNDLQTINPVLSKEWHPTLNKDLTPSDVTSQSSKKVWWIDNHGHSWEAAISNRSKGSTCPYCCNQKVLKGYNDLATTNPTLTKEWHPTLNTILTPFIVTSGTSKKAWWICNKDHEWEATIGSRNQGIGCPYCARIIPILGKNDLITTHPELVKEWHPTLNGNMTPEQCQRGTDRLIWWQCVKNHEWRTSVKMRAIHNNNCPHCSRSKTSQQEIKIRFYLTKYFKNTDIEITTTKVANRQIDIIVTHLDQQIHIEFDGGNWHQDIEKDYERDNFLLNNVNNLEKIIRIRDQKCPEYNTNNKKIQIIVLRNEEQKALIEGLNEALIVVGTVLKIPTIPILISSEDDIAIKEYFITEKEKNSIQITHPEIAKQFHPTKNGILTASNISRGERIKLWWLCPLNHEWEATIKNRALNKTGCPYCSGNKVWTGFNDLVTTHPEIAAEWNFDLNDIIPQDVMIGSKQIVWWKCKNNHEWQTRLLNRRNKNSCCKQCT